MAIYSRIQELHFDCIFQTIIDVSTDLYFSQYLAFAELLSHDDPSPPFNLLIDFSSSQHLLVASLCTGIPLKLTFDTLKDTLYHRLDILCISTSYRFCLQLWFDELPLMSCLQFWYPDLYVNNSFCPNCGIFMETLE
ncbi:hypothetical protein RhiirC2_796178 [Rhizophagus irregularis]|uniref:Uncharacterized protein n=1 Tax=Rhizophagus irregularis TaxID=588596 RepID=A0A2N1MA83_9GLOM|nr:hypothetical protein RhiirC2_796178 [Rhizophagus irregularis]